MLEEETMKTTETSKTQRSVQRQLAQDLEDLKRYLSDLWHFLPLPLCYVNPRQVILDANREMEDFFGWPSSELIGKKIETLFSNKAQAEKIFQEVLKKKDLLRQEAGVITKSKTRKTVTVLASSREDRQENVIGLYFAFSDISELKELQEKLEERVEMRTKETEKKVEELADSRKALMNILEDVEEAREEAEVERRKTEMIIKNFADGLMFFDRRAILRIFNPQAEVFFKVSAVEILNQEAAGLKKFPSLSPVLKLLEREEKKLFREEVSLHDNLILEVTSIAVLDRAEGEVAGTLVIMHDVTREKHVERMKTEFVSIAAHQLRTPLSAIKWTLRMLLDGDVGRLSKEQLDLLEKTYQSNERMIGLINDLLNVTRIEEGRYIFKPTLVQLEQLCQEVIDAAKEGILRKKINFGFLTPREKLPPVKIDSEKIKLVIQNLLDNAIKYTTSGGRVTISLKKGKKEVELEIQDNGVGIPRDQQERVFTRFFRGANIIRLETTGTGLGLFIAKNIIEAHQGKIWFESEEGKGSTFHFTLPTVEE